MGSRLELQRYKELGSDPLAEVIRCMTLDNLTSFLKSVPSSVKWG
jgi:hypothetical protein